MKSKLNGLSGYSNETWYKTVSQFKYCILFLHTAEWQSVVSTDCLEGKVALFYYLGFV